MTKPALTTNMFKHSGKIVSAARQFGIDVNRRFRTIDGDWARVIAVDAGHPFPFVGDIYDAENETTWLCRWNTLGHYSGTEAAASRHSLRLNAGPNAVNTDTPDEKQATRFNDPRGRTTVGFGPSLRGPWPDFRPSPEEVKFILSRPGLEEVKFVRTYPRLERDSNTLAPQSRHDVGERVEPTLPEAKEAAPESTVALAQLRRILEVAATGGDPITVLVIG